MLQLSFSIKQSTQNLTLILKLIAEVSALEHFIFLLIWLVTMGHIILTKEPIIRAIKNFQARELFGTGTSPGPGTGSFWF